MILIYIILWHIYNIDLKLREHDGLGTSLNAAFRNKPFLLCALRPGYSSSSEENKLV
jgi:hypothetical protein